MRKPLQSIAVMLTGIMLLGACAERGGAAGPPAPDSPVTSSPLPSGPIPEPTPKLVTPRPGLVEPRPHAWESLEVEDQRTLLIQYYGGVEECYGLHHVEVEYGKDQITVTIYEGREPEARVCIEIAMLKAVRVHLDEPLNGRKVVDGSTRGA